MTMAILTLATLKAKGACADQCALFRSKFGDSVDVTPELCVSVAAQFDWGWAACNLLTAPALADYERATAAAWADYDRAKAAPARADFERATAAAWADYERARAAAWADYDRAKAPALADYGRARAPAFGLAFNSQN
jgi:hypothetical protein